MRPRIIILRLRGSEKWKAQNYLLVGEDNYCWYGIPVDNQVAGIQTLPKFIWMEAN